MSQNPLVSLARQAIGLGPLKITTKQKYLALLLAGVVDVAQATVIPTAGAGAMSPIQWGVDIATAVLLTFVLGWNWRLLVAFGIELIPGASLFPTWSALMLTLTTLATTTDDKKLPEAAGKPAAVPPAGPPGAGSLPGPSAPVGAGEKFPGVYQKRSR